MSLETLSQVGEFVGGIGVILSLVYLAFQVRGNTRSQRADMTARILDRMASQQHTYAFDAEASKFFTRAITNPTGLTVDERNQFAWLMTEFLSAMECLMQQYQAGNVDAFTAFGEDRLINGKGDFNEENWRSYLVSGQPG